MDIRLSGTQKEIDKLIADFENTRKQVKSKEVRVYVKMNMTYIDENGSLQKI